MEYRASQVLTVFQDETVTMVHQVQMDHRVYQAKTAEMELTVRFYVTQQQFNHGAITEFLLFL